MKWTDASIATLRTLWAERVQVVEIAARTGHSKSAVSRKAHDLDLPKRKPYRFQAGGNETATSNRKAAVKARRAECVRQAVALKRAGHSAAEIAEKMGAHIDTARAWLRTAGENRRPGAPAKVRHWAPRNTSAAKERRERDIRTAVEMHHAGHDTREIAAALDVHYDTARLYLQAGGVELSTRRRAALPAKRDHFAGVSKMVLPLGKGTCRWPIGEPRTPGFRYCDDPALLGRPYCAACCQRAYVPAQVSGLSMMPRRWAA